LIVDFRPLFLGAFEMRDLPSTGCIRAEESVARYLHHLGRADRQKPSLAYTTETLRYQATSDRNAWGAKRPQQSDPDRPASHSAGFRGLRKVDPRLGLTRDAQAVCGTPANTDGTELRNAARIGFGMMRRMATRRLLKPL
jgi:hypothetical protein